MQPTRKINPAIAALIIIVLIAVVVGAVVIIKNNSQQNDSDTVDTSTTQNTETQSTDSSAEESTTESAVSYKDGTYTETGLYSSPGGRESIEVTVTLTNDIITSTSVKANAASGEAKQYQNDFISGYKASVVGKDVDEVSLSRVAGSSLTSNGFNAALKLIKVDAGA